MMRFSMGFAAAILLVFLVAIPTPSQAGGECTLGPVSCGPHASLPRRVCSANLQCSTASVATVSVIGSTGVVGCAPLSSMNTGIGSMVTINLVASASTTDQTTHQCSWMWNTQSVANGTAVIDASDGLPIELLEFGVDEAGLGH